jgi:flagellum-specific ATP synthase
MNEPVADAVRSILDGHIVLNRELAAQNHYPAIDVLNSISRVMNDVVPRQHAEKSQKLKSVLATYRKAEDLINIGAYVSGSNPAIDYAMAKIGVINRYLQQDMGMAVSLETSVRQLAELFTD